MKEFIRLPVCLFVLVIGFSKVGMAQSEEKKPKVIPPAEILSDGKLLKDVTGSELQQIIDSYQGEKAVLVNVWATWCAPCVEEFPDIVKLQRAYPEQLKVIFVSADFKDSRGKAIGFLREQNVDWTTYFKTGKDQEFIASLSDEWTGAMPFTKVIGRDGTVVASWEQGAEYSKFEDNVKTAINP
jgi:thiol-disulfide isomerase/thioredoxin